MSSTGKSHPRAVTHRTRSDGSNDAVVVEEPLEIQVGGETLAITMRTPGSDEFLTAGFLFAEGRIRNKGDIRAIGYADPPEVSRGKLANGHATKVSRGKLAKGHVTKVSRGKLAKGHVTKVSRGKLAKGHVTDIATPGCNTMDVTPSDGAARLKPSQPVKRGTVSTSACGVCGRQTIADLLEVCSPQPVAPTMPADVLARATTELAAHQPVFAETGGCHAAAILDVGGKVLATHEDVGRHNAVDKAVGELVFDGLLDRATPAQSGAGLPTCLVVSGRVSFEIVQKAAVAGIPVVASVSAASSLAIDLATEMGITLVAFARDGRYTVYSHPDRVTS